MDNKIADTVELVQIDHKSDQQKVTEKVNPQEQTISEIIKNIFKLAIPTTLSGLIEGSFDTVNAIFIG
jgi:Na+-driven multidrug efflux pump